jgi:Alkylmercury lyase
MNTTEITHAALHHAIARHFVDHGHAPTVAQLCVQFGCSAPEMTAGLQALEAYHGVVLHPGSAEIWAMHPFSNAPTSFWVESARGAWWGNCAWCSLGIAAVLGEDVTITSRFGGEREPVVITVRNGVVEPSTHVVHFPVPMTQAWDNVMYTCSVMLLFPSGAAVDEWCIRHAVPRGDVQPIARVWELARVWYAHHLSPSWVKWTGDEAREIFARVGMTGPVWELPQTVARF